jgi:hypothetical protein
MFMEFYPFEIAVLSLVLKLCCLVTFRPHDRPPRAPPGFVAALLFSIYSERPVGNRGMGKCGENICNCDENATIRSQLTVPVAGPV